jgi:hypothetical protein
MKTARYTSTLKGAGLAREYCYQMTSSPIAAMPYLPSIKGRDIRFALVLKEDPTQVEDVGF